MSALKAGVTGQPGAYRGVIRDGSRIVWTCGHTHHNRDCTTYRISARTCAGVALDVMTTGGATETVRLARVSQWLNNSAVPADWTRRAAYEAYKRDSGLLAEHMRDSGLIGVTEKTQIPA